MVTTALVILVAALAAHFIEEVATGFRRKFPLGEIPRPLFYVINAVIYSFAFVMIGLYLSGHPAFIPMSWVFSIGVGLNGLAHLAMMVIRRAYFPGGVTAALLVAASLNSIVALRGL